MHRYSKIKYENYSHKLKLFYTYKEFSDGEKQIIFEDNIKYNDNEIKFLKNKSVKMLNDVHKIKKIFAGEIIRG